MGVQKMMVDAVDPDQKWLYRVGGVSALVLGIAYIAIIGLYVPVGAPPSGAEARLTHLAGKTTVWWAILALSVLTDFLFVPVALSLYLALKRINRNAMLLATACVGLFVVLDLAVTWTSYASLITLSGTYAAATNDVQRAVVVATANYPSAVLESKLSHPVAWRDRVAIPVPRAMSPLEPADAGGSVYGVDGDHEGFILDVVAAVREEASAPSWDHSQIQLWRPSEYSQSSKKEGFRRSGHRFSRALAKSRPCSRYSC